MCEICPNNHGAFCERARKVFHDNIKNKKHKKVTCDKPTHIDEKDCWTCQNPKASAFYHEND